MTYQTPTEPDAAFLAECIAYIAERGYKVTKARAGRSTTDAELPADGRKRAKDPTGHGGCAEHWRLAGYSKPLCIARPGTGDDGLPIGEEWTDREQALAFAAELASTAGDPLKVARLADVARRNGTGAATAAA